MTDKAKPLPTIGTRRQGRAIVISIFKEMQTKRITLSETEFEALKKYFKAQQ